MGALLFCIIAAAAMLLPHASSFTCPEVARGASRRRGGAPQSSLHASKESVLVSAESRVSLSRPPIHYTVPGFKAGWRDAAGKWFDEDGPRDGPPLNYWRQSADEREYNGAMSAVDAILAEYDVDSMVEALEHRCSSRMPSLSRLLLGQWAPLLLSGRRMAFNDKPTDDGGEIEVPFLVDIARNQGRRFGPKNRYGIFDLKLEHGEELAIATVTANDRGIMSTKLIADEANERVTVGTMEQVQLQFGGITYVSDYILIQRRADGAIDFFLRADKSHLGATQEEKEKYHLI